MSLRVLVLVSELIQLVGIKIDRVSELRRAHACVLVFSAEEIRHCDRHHATVYMLAMHLLE